MLNANEKTANDFVRVRAELRDLCFDAEIEGECLISVIKRNERSLLRSKYLFHIPKGGPTELEVRHKIRQLRRLTDYLKTYGFELKHNQGLWIPAVADQEEGDTQLNVMVSENWVTKNVTAAAISDDLSSANSPDIRSVLDRASASFSEFRICRRSGHSYRVAIRNKDGSRRTSGLNQFCIALGDQIQIVTADNRYRKKRGDAWRGVEKPLFKYVGREGPTWFVYPVLESQK